MTNYIRLDDGSLQRSDGAIVFLSLDRFHHEIINGDACFICCAKPSEKSFNDEHVIPDWVLRECKIRNGFITLPNGKPYPYGRYKIPCCQECNSRLGQHIETPMSERFKGGYGAFCKSLANDPKSIWPVFQWMCLLYLKTHLKDKKLPYSLDRRIKDGTIADRLDWEFFHHVHCIARAHFTGAAIDTRVIGSVFVLPALSDSIHGTFDFGDLHPYQALMIRINEIAIVAVLDDSGACCSAKPKFLRDTKGKLGGTQLREILTRVAYMNALLKQRPRFHSSIEESKYRISVDLPPRVEFEPACETDFGALMYNSIHSLIDFDANDPSLADNIRSGRWTCLVDEQGEFIHQTSRK
jgi:hypothetical protein